MTLISDPAPGLDTLRSAFTGELHTPADASYDPARAAWNLLADQRPALVALPRTAEDVVALVEYARAADLRIAPQGTGHNAGALGSLERSILLKTSLMRDVQIDAGRMRARVEAGALCDDLLAPASELGLAPLAGSSPDVGLVGFALGGGIGWLSRAFGLCCNSVAAIEVVTADGRLVRCDHEQEPELFWALRGGTGSFGVVTAIELMLVTVPSLYAGAMLWPWERASEVLHAWRAWTLDAPETATTSARILQLPPIPDIPEPFRGRQFVCIDGAIIGSEAYGAEVLSALKALEPEIDSFGMAPPIALSHLHMDPEHPVPGISEHALLADLSPEAIDAFVATAGPGSGSPLLVAELRHLGGALTRVPAGAGARALLDAPYAFFAVGSPMTPELHEAIPAHLERFLDAIAPWAAEKIYLNFAERPSDAARAFDEDCWARLRRVKALVDPDDLIQSNHAVPPLKGM